MNIQEQILNACNEAIHDDPDDGVCLDTAGTQILAIKELVEGDNFSTLVKAAETYLHDLVQDLWAMDRTIWTEKAKAEADNQLHLLASSLGFSREQTNKAIEEGYFASTDKLDGEE